MNRTARRPVPFPGRLPTGFCLGRVRVDDVEFHLLDSDSQGRATVVLLHGHTQTCEMWAPLAQALAERDFRVICPDLPDLGRSSAGGQAPDKASIAGWIHEAVIKTADPDASLYIVGHDLGAFVAYAMAAQFGRPDDRLVLMDAVLPGIGVWEELLKQSMTWHFGFYGPYAERLVAGRERIYLDRFWDEFSAVPSAFPDPMRAFYAQFYSGEGAGKAFGHFATFGQDARDNASFARSPLTMPVLGLGGDQSLGPLMGDHLALIADNPTVRILPGAGHWLLEERPEAVTSEVVRFLTSKIPT